MRVAIFTDTYPPFINGVSTSSYNLRKTLKDHGDDVLLIAPRTTNGPTEVIDDIIYLSGLEIKKIYGYRITTFYSEKVYKMVKAFKPDVIHIQTDFSIGQFARIVARKLKTVPVVYTYHTAYEDYTYYVAKGFADRMAKRIIRAYSKNTSQSVTEYITPSDKTMDYMRTSGSDAYINVVPTGIDFSIFKDENIDKEKMAQFKKEHGITDKTKVFLILGRIAQEKSMDISIRGFHEFKTKYPNIPCKMLVVGDGPQRSELQNLVYELKEVGNVEFIGSVPASEVPFYYHLADIYTSASVTETQGLTFMEAMASGTIVLARFDSQLTETIEDGETGFFFNDLNTFAEKSMKILSLEDEEKQKIVKKAYEKVDIYSIDKFYDNINRVYKRAIRKKW